MRMYPVRVLSLAIALLLPACGGGGGDPATTGYFTAVGPVAGVTYRTATQGGVTGADGAFSYQPGEEVTFSVGATQLGAPASAQAALSPLDLVPGSFIPTTGLETRVFLRRPSAFPEVTELVNLLAFLRAFDADKDPSNGTSIHAAVATILASTALDFDRDIWNFSKEMRPSLYAALAEGAVATALVVNWGFTLDEFAAARGVVPQVFLRAESSDDADANGVVDNKSMLSLDARRLPSMYSYDSNADGTPDQVTTYQYDANGNQIRYERDSDGNGTPDQITTYQFDANGNRIRSEQDTDANGTPDLIGSYQYDANGNRTRYEDDSDANA